MGGDEQRGIRPVQGGDHWATTDHEPLISSRSRRPGETGDGQPGSQMEWQIYKLQVASGTVTEPAEQQSFQHWVASRVHRVLLNGFFHTTKARLVPFQGTGHRAQGILRRRPESFFLARAHAVADSSSSSRHGRHSLPPGPTNTTKLNASRASQPNSRPVPPLNKTSPVSSCQVSNDTDTLFSQQTG